MALALSGVGNGLSTPSTVSSASNEVAPDELGVMSAAQQLITQIGIVAGIQVMVTVQASAHGGVGSLASFHRAYAVGAVVAVLAGVCGFFMRNTPGHGSAAGPPRCGATGPWPDGLTSEAYSVMARMRAAISAAAGSGVIDCRAISLAMSPSTLILPDMKAWMPAWGLPSTRMALATS